MDTLDRLPKGVNLLPYVPMNPLLGYVMGIEESKTGRMPTDDEHAQMRRLLHEAMDAGACGWSAQRLMPDGPSAGAARLRRLADEHRRDARRDLPRDGASARRARRGLPGTDAGELGSEGGREHFEKIAEVSGRPIMYEAVATQIASRIAIATR